MRKVLLFLSLLCVLFVFSCATNTAASANNSIATEQSAPVPSTVPDTQTQSPASPPQSPQNPHTTQTPQPTPPLPNNQNGAALPPVPPLPPDSAKDAEQTVIKQPQKKPYAQTVLESYKAAYPHKELEVFCKDGEWGIICDKTRFWWADGKLLPETLLSKIGSYGAQVIYPYTAKPRDPTLYTKAHIAELRKKGTAAAIAAEKPIDDSFLCALLDTRTRAKTETHIKKTQLFGKRTNIHELLVPLFAAIDTEVTALSKTNADVAHFLTTIYEVGGYNWRTIDGTNSRRSNHSYGIAVDITIKNNKKTTYWEWERVWNADWMLVPQKRLWSPPESVVKVFEKYGFVWGGTWDEYDTMHFEYRPELHELHSRLQADGTM